MHHIITNYDNLATLTVFLPGSCDLDYKKKDCASAISKAIIHGITTVPKPGTVLDYRAELEDYQLKNYHSSHSSNKLFDEDMELCKDRPFGVWYAKNFGDQPIRSIVWRGIFAVTDAQVKARDKAFYQKLISYLDKHSNPEAGHFVERAWATIFTKNDI